MSWPFSAVLLAGGRSSRMGTDKALIPVAGEPLWQRQLRILQETNPRELFLAGPSRCEPHPANCILVPDIQTDIGPLAGITAALRRCSAPLLLTLAIDLPKMTSEWLRSLLALCGSAKGVIPLRSGRYEPVAAVYPIAALAVAESCIALREYSLQDFAAQCVSQELVQTTQIARDQEALFLNINTPEELRALTHD